MRPKIIKGKSGQGLQTCILHSEKDNTYMSFLETWFLVTLHSEYYSQFIYYRIHSLVKFSYPEFCESRSYTAEDELRMATFYRH